MSALLGWSTAVATATVALVALLGLAGRRRAASFRHALWATGLGGVAAAPALLALVLFRDAAVSAPAHPSGASWTVAPAPDGHGLLVACAWLLPAAVLLARSVLGWALAAAAVRRARPLADTTWHDDAHASAMRLGLTAAPRIAVSDEVPGPAVTGVLRPVLLLPPSAREAPSALRRAILDHELAHVARHDVLVTRLAALARALHWCNPLVWWAVRRLDLDAECACDDAVLAGGLSSRDYVTLLVRAAAGASLAPAPAGAGFGSAPVVKRVEALASPARKRGALTGRDRWLLAVAAACALLPALGGAAWASARRDEPTVIRLQAGTLVVKQVSPSSVEVHQVPRPPNAR